MKGERINGILHFYLSLLAVPAGIVTIICLYTYYQNRDGAADAIIGLLWFKAATYLPLCYVINNVRAKRFYYYYNLHLSRRLLWASAIIADLGIFCFVLFLIHFVA